MALAHAIVGRDTELAQLREIVQGAGAPFAVFIEGDAGVGKTALMDSVVARTGVVGAAGKAQRGRGGELLRRDA